MARLKNYFLAFTVILMYSNALAVQTVKLSSNHDMPVVGLGTYLTPASELESVVTTALENGYKHIDTAFVYQTEKEIGKALKKWFDKGNKREDIFITTKLPPVGDREADVEAYLNSSLKDLGVDYVDMYLIHVPTGALRKKDSLDFDKSPEGAIKIDWDTDHISLWKGMEAQVKAGRAKSIGLSNFNTSQIQNIINHSEIKPSNLQVEIQGYNQQKELRDFCKRNNIAVTAFSSLGGSTLKNDYRPETYKKLPKLKENSIVKKIAEAHNKSTAQVLLRHQVQEGLIVIPKSTKVEHIKDNINIFDFELTEKELKELDSLDKGEDGRIVNFLIFKGIENHKEYPWTAQIPKAKELYN